MDTSNEPLTVTPKNFESHLRYLEKSNIETLTINELLEGKDGGKSIVITFDDGHLSQYQYAYPLLEKYSKNATIFVTTDWMVESDLVRPTLEDMWTGRTEMGSLPEIPGLTNSFHLAARGDEKRISAFPTWSEIRTMAVSPNIDIGSHGKNHGAIFSSPRVTGFNDGRCWWLLTATGGDERIGLPIYENASNLIQRTFFDDPHLRNHMAKFADDLDLEPGNRKWRNSLKEEFHSYRNGHSVSESYEDEELARTRINELILSSKRKIKEEVGSNCETISYPHGEYNSFLKEILSETGFTSGLTTVNGAYSGKNDPLELPRIHVPDIGFSEFGAIVEAYQNKNSAKVLTQLSHLLRVLKGSRRTLYK